MNFLRAHAFYIICGVAAAAGVALGVTGLRAMPRVLVEMDRAVRLSGDLEALAKKPVNQNAIDAERNRIEATLADHEKIIGQARDMFRYQPLTAKAFPNGNEPARREFQRKYREAMDNLYQSLRPGQPATAVQIDEMKEKIANELASNSLEAGSTGGPARTAAGVLTRDGARLDPEARASMAAAQRIYCYATPYIPESKEAIRARGRESAKNVASLDYDPIMMDVSAVEAPTPEDVWRAQVSYWIQKDVTEAIAAVNDERAAEARAADQEVWVGIMPVKEVIAIRVAIEYVFPGGERYADTEAGGYDEALPPNSVGNAFTQSASNKLFEVRQFTVKLIMEQRDIPRLINRLSNGTFHIPLRVTYKAFPPNKDMRGKIYGSGAVVNVIMDFETVMLGKMFRELMPPAVCEALAGEGYGIECPKIAEEEDEAPADEEG